MSKLSVTNTFTGWPDDSRAIAQNIIDKYGDPDEVTPSMLIWYHNGPWKKTIVYRNTVKHNFPVPHSDGLEQFIDHEAPMEKACELAAFNGSLVIHCTQGELSACCHNEAFNLLTINLAHDIIIDKKTFGQAREFYTDSVAAYLKHKSVPYMESLRFPPQIDTPDPDEPSINEKDLSKVVPRL